MIEIVVCRTGMDRHARDLPQRAETAGARVVTVDCFDKCETCERVLLVRIEGMMVRFASTDELVNALADFG